MSILSNFLQAMSSGAASHFAEKDANRRESKRYKKFRSRALEDEKERRARSLKYNEEDYGIQQLREQEWYQKQRGRRIDEDQRLYDLERARAIQEEQERRSRALKYNEEDYGIQQLREQEWYQKQRGRRIDEDQRLYDLKRARGLQEEQERRSRALRYNEEDYGIQQRRKGDEQEQLIDAAKAVGKQIGDPDYVNQAIVKAFGLPSLPDKTNQAIKQKQLEYWKNQNSAALRGPIKGQIKDLLETYKILENQLKNSYEFDTIQSRFVSRLLPQEERDLREAMRNILYQIDSFTRGQNTVNADGSNPLLIKIIEGGNKVFGMGEDNPVEPYMPQKPGAKDIPEKSIQAPDFSPMSPAMSPAIINPDKPDYRPLVGGIRYDRNAPIYKFLRYILTPSKPGKNQGRLGNTSGVYSVSGFGFGPKRNQ